MSTEKSGPTVNTTENPCSSSDTANQEFLVLTYVSVYSDNYGLALIILNIGHRSSFAKKVHCQRSQMLWIFPSKLYSKSILLSQVTFHCSLKATEHV